MPDSTSFSSFLSDPIELVKFIGGIVSIIGGLVAIGVVFFTKALPWWRTRRDRRSLEKRFGAELYHKAVIERSTQYYIDPFCQSLDPAGSEEPRLVYGARQNLFDAIANMMNQPTEYRYLILLADSGMGKTSFLLNYYARHLRQRLRKFELALVPLGIPDADERINAINNKGNTVLFLDALDEDTLAIVDHVARLRDLLRLTRDFSRVLITCRTQFFPKEEEIPSETGIVKIGPKAAGEKAQYRFHKLYLSPFTDEQVQAYLKRRYPFAQRRRRKFAQTMVQKIPNLSVRPMLLSHIDDLVCANREIKYSFELYEDMVEAWLVREEGIVPGLKKEPLRQFSERLAVDLYVNRKRRGAERIPRAELAELAKSWNIPLIDWQLSGRSLLNRDAAGNYKFAHRSIMEYLFVKRFTAGEKDCCGLEWTDQMKKFLWEIFRHHVDSDTWVPFDMSGVDVREIALSLRSKPLTKLSRDDVNTMLSQRGFFDVYRNKNGKGIIHLYELRQKSQVVMDYATCLMWQQSGSRTAISHEYVQTYIQFLNQNRFAGYDDWRLPTLEEAMSLIEPKKHGEFYLNRVFVHEQTWVWTSDHHGDGAAWVVSFFNGYCNCYHSDYGPFVRVVRDGKAII
ncbi:DUF1566 domain-containing protein [candidate division KSB1 bacterium]|nr:DUF1566 domain-containing protein [candidate division KSB1 bacterium]